MDDGSLDRVPVLIVLDYTGNGCQIYRFYVPLIAVRSILPAPLIASTKTMAASSARAARASGVKSDIKFPKISEIDFPVFGLAKGVQSRRLVVNNIQRCRKEPHGAEYA